MYLFFSLLWQQVRRCWGKVKRLNYRRATAQSTATATPTETGYDGDMQPDKMRTTTATTLMRLCLAGVRVPACVCV